MASKKILIQVDVTTKSAEVNVDKLVSSMKELEGATVRQSKATKNLKTDTGLNNAILLKHFRFSKQISNLLILSLLKTRRHNEIKPKSRRKIISGFQTFFR